MSTNDHRSAVSAPTASTATGTARVPARIQLRRTKGWRKPAGAVVVSRPSRWGNPYLVDGECVFDLNSDQWWSCAGQTHAREFAVDLFVEHIIPTLDVEPLRGHELACWCPLDAPCHADVLLSIANGETT